MDKKLSDGNKKENKLILDNLDKNKEKPFLCFKGKGSLDKTCKEIMKNYIKLPNPSSSFHKFLILL